MPGEPFPAVICNFLSGGLWAYIGLLPELESWVVEERRAMVMRI